ncbi:hypothetical protein [Ancylomarina sp. 16SWW S1-10-2]|uniref:hypothetical protein n=1 Tax=Ancylomarina sp. 16SWW S1-10-2 TaxID=2499681 RepID=UPI0012AD620C|nr:hypothetical protein [Ancylomarina sp. 16SWW S1-10-2]MRT94144.1 hypothetical protein [Ancylomarina sp. 16SWW S1-10-2]
MSFIKKYSYLRALFVGVPFGISCIIGGIRVYNETAEFEDLIMEEGIIYNIESKIIEEGERIYDFVELTLADGSKYSSGEYKNDILSFFAEKPYKNKIIKYNNEILSFPIKELYKNKTIKIWHEERQDNIRQLSVGEEVLIEYSAPYWMAYFFFLLGVITLVSALIYVIKHPEDYTGEKKK